MTTGASSASEVPARRDPRSRPNPGVATEPIALLIPCYNAEAHLEKLLVSVAAQTRPFAEVICYDDGSTDRTAEVAAAHGARVVRGEMNRGAAYARNRLLAEARTDWVHFHDADDLLEPEFVQRMGALAAGAKGPVLCGMKTIDRSTGRVLGQASFARLGEPGADPIAFFLEHMAFSIVGVYPRDLLRRIGGFDESLRGHEDPDFHFRLAKAGVPFRVEAAALVTNVVRPDSFSVLNRRRCVEDALRCLESYEPTLPERYLPLLGQMALKTAYELCQLNAADGARRAVSLAKRCGIREVDSHRWTMRTLSRTIGLEKSLRFRRVIHHFMRGRDA